MGEDMIFIASNILPQYLIYESVIIAAGCVAVEKVWALGLLSNTTLAELIKGAWREFVESVSSGISANRQVPIAILENRCSYNNVSFQVQSFFLAYY